MPRASRHADATVSTQANSAGERSPFDAFYSSEAWKMTRRAYLCLHPLCEFVLNDRSECGVVADSVHHRQKLTQGGAPRDPENLQSLCRAHHSVVHARRRRWGGQLKPTAYLLVGFERSALALQLRGLVFNGGITAF